MRFRAASIVMTSFATINIRLVSGFQPSSSCLKSALKLSPIYQSCNYRRNYSRQFLSSSDGQQQQAQLKNVGLEEMDDLINDYEERGREETGMIIMDVRNEDEVQYTGKLSPNTITLPLPAIMQYNIFALPEDEFEELCGFEKPTLDETLVFSCAAGIR